MPRILPGFGRRAGERSHCTMGQKFLLQRENLCDTSHSTAQHVTKLAWKWWRSFLLRGIDGAPAVSKSVAKLLSRATHNRLWTEEAACSKTSTRKLQMNPPLAGKNRPMMSMALFRRKSRPHARIVHPGVQISAPTLRISKRKSNFGCRALRFICINRIRNGSSVFLFSY